MGSSGDGGAGEESERATKRKRRMSLTAVYHPTAALSVSLPFSFSLFFYRAEEGVLRRVNRTGSVLWPAAR